MFVLEPKTNFNNRVNVDDIGYDNEDVPREVGKYPNLRQERF